MADGKLPAGPTERSMGRANFSQPCKFLSGGCGEALARAQRIGNRYKMMLALKFPREPRAKGNIVCTSHPEQRSSACFRCAAAGSVSGMLSRS